MMSSVRVLRLLAQFIAIPILSRLLTPAEYGVVAIAMPFALFAMMVADAGIGMSLVRTPATDKAAWSSSFWLSSLLGLGFAIVMAALGPVMAWLFHEPILAPMLAVLSLVVLAQAVHLIPVAALQQEGRFKAIAAVEILATMAGILAAVIMAYQHYGAWALIGQQVAFFAVRVSLMCWLSPFRPHRTFRWQSVRDHVLFGRNVLGSGMVNYFARAGDNWVVGKALGAAPVGIYSMAFQFARLPAMMVTGPLQYVVYAQLAKIKDDPAAIARVYLLLTRLLALLVLPAMGMVAVANAPIFTILLSEKWVEAGYIFMLVAPACAVQAVVGISETMVYALGRTDIPLRASVEYCVVWMLALLAAASFGLTAAALTFTLLTLAYQLRYLGLVLPLLGVSLRQYLSAYRVAFVVTCLGMGLYALIAHLLPIGLWAAVGLAIGLGAAVLALGGWVQRADLKREVKSLKFGESTAA